MSSHSFSANELSPREVYGLISGLVVPRPIALVSTCSSDGRRNLAPFSFFMLGGSNPPTACFSPTPSRSGEKDTLRNIRETREYVINLVDGEMLHGMNATSALLPPNESEWELTEFEPMPGLKVGPAWIKNTPAAFEMNLIEVVEVGTGPGASRFVIGEIVALHVRQDLLVDAPNEDGGAQLHPGAGKMIARLGENGYIDLANCPSFDLHRPH